MSYFYHDGQKQMWNGQLRSPASVTNLTGVTSTELVWYEGQLNSIIKFQDRPRLQDEYAQALYAAADFMWPNALVQIYHHCHRWFPKFLDKMKPYASPAQMQYLEDILGKDVL